MEPRSIRINFLDGREFDAEVKGADQKSDIVVLEIKVADVPALNLATPAINGSVYWQAAAEHFVFRVAASISGLFSNH